MKSPPNLQAQLKTARLVPIFREANTRTVPIAIGINRAYKTCPAKAGANPKEKLFLNPKAFGTNASKKIKHPTHKPDKKALDK